MIQSQGGGYIFLVVQVWQKKERNGIEMQAL